jgi:hypothetical protein
VRQTLSQLGDAAAGIAGGFGQLMLTIDQVRFYACAKIAELPAATPATLQMIGDLLSRAF